MTGKKKLKVAAWPGSLSAVIIPPHGSYFKVLQQDDIRQVAMVNNANLDNEVWIQVPSSETFEKYKFLCEFKKGENFNHPGEIVLRNFTGQARIH